jgi:hypothetical protein
MRAGTKPWSPSPFTGRARCITDKRMPCDAVESAACSESMRRAAAEVGSGTFSSVPRRPGEVVPEIRTGDRPDSASAPPIASIVSLSVSLGAAESEKS